MRRLAALFVAAAGCTTPDYYIDQFAVPVDLDAGVPIMFARAADLNGGALLSVVIDTAAPLTVLDDGTGVVSRRPFDLDLLRPGSPPVTRARFLSVSTILAEVGAVGQGTPRAIAGVIGGDVLTRIALRIDPRRGQLQFFPDIAGSDASHEETCDAVFNITLGGGGRIAVGNDTTHFAPTRVVLGACLAPDPAACLESRFPCKQGNDALLLVATGVAPTILSRSSYKRATGASDATVDALPKTMLYLDTSAGGELVPTGSVPGLALVGHEGDRGPCAELVANRVMARGGCATTTNVACPCDEDNDEDEDGMCPAAAVVEMLQTIEVVVLADTHPLLQGLRNELRPGIADIDGLLGWNALRPLVTDLDYPHDRVIMRCASTGPACVQRPRISDPVSERRVELAACL